MSEGFFYDLIFHQPNPFEVHFVYQSNNKNIMKRILQTLAIALLLPLAGSAQNLLTVSGIVTDANGPIAFQNITITSASNVIEPGVFIDAVETDENGLFESVTDLETAYEMITILADSCGFTATVAIDSYPSENYFQIACDSSSTGGGDNGGGDNGGNGDDEDCLALFIPAIDSIADGILYFYNMSEGEDLNYEWTFGDGNVSTEQFPTHEYEDGDGEYNVCLYVWNETCVDTLCMVISGNMDGNPAGSGLVGAGNNGGRYGQQGQAKTDGLTLVVLDGSDVLSTKQEFKETEMTVFPNPSNGLINLKLQLAQAENGAISVLDMTGKMVYQGSHISNENIEIDLSSLDSGIYLVQFRGTDSIATRKIIIE